jgi:hypothetical protein
MPALRMYGTASAVWNDASISTEKLYFYKTL